MTNYRKSSNRKLQKDLESCKSKNNLKLYMLRKSIEESKDEPEFQDNNDWKLFITAYCVYLIIWLLVR
jgi:hypothetical protein